MSFMKLSNQQIRKILTHYNIGDFKKKKLVYNAWNTSYKVTATKGDYLVKYLNFHNKGLLDRELNILRHLDKNIPIAFPVNSKEGKPYIIYNKKYMLVFKFINAKPVLKGEQLKEPALRELVDQAEFEALSQPGFLGNGNGLVFSGGEPTPEEVEEDEVEEFESLLTAQDHRS
jgi:Ser/Thr protein kinase RdoA (MazF antagonist)